MNYDSNRDINDGMNTLRQYHLLSDIGVDTVNVLISVPRVLQSSINRHDFLPYLVVVADVNDEVPVPDKDLRPYCGYVRTDLMHVQCSKIVIESNGNFALFRTCVQMIIRCRTAVSLKIERIRAMTYVFSRSSIVFVLRSIHIHMKPETE
jgi:hypothetical protein